MIKSVSILFKKVIKEDVRDLEILSQIKRHSSLSRELLEDIQQSTKETNVILSEIKTILKEIVEESIKP